MNIICHNVLNMVGYEIKIMANQRLMKIEKRKDNSKKKKERKKIIDQSDKMSSATCFRIKQKRSNRFLNVLNIRINS